MVRHWSRRATLRRGVAAASAGLAGCLGVLSGPSPEERVREHEADLRRLAEVSTAIDEGYRTTGRYVRGDEGVLGEQFVNLGEGGLDPARPAGILYDLSDDGQYRPAGVKWLVPAEERDTPPTLFGREFVGPLEFDTPLLPPHYALHAWLFRENPEGVFATYNPAIDPPAFVDGIDPVRDRLFDLLLGNAATDAGYANTERCISSADGVYGVPFVRGGDGTDPERPPVLLYRLTQSWAYRLMGAEWYVPASEEPPELFGRRFHDPMPGHSGKTEQPEHHGLHAWLFRANPKGMFAPFNPAVTC